MGLRIHVCVSGVIELRAPSSVMNLLSICEEVGTTFMGFLYPKYQLTNIILACTDSVTIHTQPQQPIATESRAIFLMVRHIANHLLGPDTRTLRTRSRYGVLRKEEHVTPY